MNGSDGIAQGGIDSDADGGESEIARILRRASALKDFGRPDEAIEELRRGIGGHPDSAQLWAGLSWSLFQADEYGESRIAAERALALDPENVTALLALGFAEVSDGAADRAHAAADRVLALEPELPTAHLVKALAYGTEEGGVERHREIIRQAAHYAVALAPENPEVLHFAARVLLVVADEQEVVSLVDQGLALDPQHEQLLMLAASLKTKTDADHVAGLSQVLAQNPQQAEAAMLMSHIVWTRTRWVSALAVWSMPAMLLPAVAIGMVVVSIANIWMLTTKVRKAAPRGFLGRTWSTPAWARAGVVLSFVGAAWPFAAIPLLASGSYGLLPLAPLALLVGECLVVLAADLDVRRILPTLGAQAPDWAAGLSRTARRGWFRIVVGAAVLVVGTTMLIRGSGTVRWAPLVIVIGLAFAVPPLLILLLRRRSLRETRGEPAPGLHRSSRAVAIAAVAAAVALTAAMAIFPPPVAEPADAPPAEDTTMDPEEIGELLREQQRDADDFPGFEGFDDPLDGNTSFDLDGAAPGQ